MEVGLPCIGFAFQIDFVLYLTAVSVSVVQAKNRFRYSEF